jgi:uncharacterized alpha/beta hydrolase family protein
MKKFYLLIVTLMIVLSSCEPVDTTPDCEKNNTGIFEVRNNSSFYLTVYLYTNSGYTNSYLILPNHIQSYGDVSAGYIDIMVNLDGQLLSFESYVAQCDTKTFTLTN